MEEFRRVRLNELASLIQNTFRAWSARSTFQRRRLAQIQIANAWRRYKVQSPLAHNNNTVSYRPRISVFITQLLLLLSWHTLWITANRGWMSPRDVVSNLLLSFYAQKSKFVPFSLSFFVSQLPRTSFLFLHVPLLLFFFFFIFVLRFWNFFFILSLKPHVVSTPISRMNRYGRWDGDSQPWWVFFFFLLLKLVDVVLMTFHFVSF